MFFCGVQARAKVGGVEVGEEEALSCRAARVDVCEWEPDVNEAQIVSAQGKVCFGFEKGLEVAEGENPDPDGGGVVCPLKMDELY